MILANRKNHTNTDAESEPEVNGELKAVLLEVAENLKLADTPKGEIRTGQTALCSAMARAIQENSSSTLADLVLPDDPLINKFLKYATSPGGIRDNPALKLILISVCNLNKASAAPATPQPTAGAGAAPTYTARLFWKSPPAARPDEEPSAS